MSAPSVTADTAFRVAERVRAEAPWDVFAERSRRYEVHLQGRTVEMVRGPIELEGYALRVFRSRDGQTGTGSQSSTDLTDAGIATSLRQAETLSRFSRFPTKKVDLPRPGASLSPVEVRDPRLWDRPNEEILDYVHALLTAFEGRKGVGPSFGSVRATLSEATVANSEGLRASYAHTTVDFEVAVKSEGGPEGAPPGEYWVNDVTRRLEPRELPRRVEEWCQFAHDVRRAAPTPTGELPVVLPPDVMGQILPAVLGFRCTGEAQLRRIAPDLGTRWAPESVTIHDDGRVPWGTASSPVDDEGTPQRRRDLIVAGEVRSYLYDALHAGAFETESTGSALRGMVFGIYRDWRRFLHPPSSTSSTLEVAPGSGGSDAEIIEATGDGLWVQQLGWAVPDPISGAFGGELRIGYRIRNGKRAEPVRGGTVGGVVAAPPGTPSMLSSIAAIGSNPVLTEWVLAPTVLVRPLTVAGA